MVVITIREQQKTATGFEAILKFQGGEYPITITDPFSPQEEKQLEWYFEDWVQNPFSNEQTATQIAANVNTYGENLFKQVFQANFQAYSEYDKLKRSLSQVQIEIESKTPEFHALYWEAMQDPGLPRPLALECVMLRKSVKPVYLPADVAESPVINLLVVTARPDEENDVAYRTISRPLIEAVENCRLRVNVELLRPGTYEALERHLEDKGTGYYHIIHFDTHGALLKFDDLQSGKQANRYTYQARYGRLDLQPYQGVKAFLFLEGESKGKAEPVEATELANLLTGKGIPVCILNACQSGKQISVEGPNPPAPFPAREGGEKLSSPDRRGVGGEVFDDSKKGGEKLSSPDRRGVGGEVFDNSKEGGEKLSSPDRRGVGGEVFDDSKETSLGSRLMSAGMQMVVAMAYSVTVTAAQLLM